MGRWKRQRRRVLAGLECTFDARLRGARRVAAGPRRHENCFSKYGTTAPTHLEEGPMHNPRSAWLLVLAHAVAVSNPLAAGAAGAAGAAPPEPRVAIEPERSIWRAPSPVLEPERVTGNSSRLILV
jgi:hypothetical protein